MCKISNFYSNQNCYSWIVWKWNCGALFMVMEETWFAWNFLQKLENLFVQQLLTDKHASGRFTAPSAYLFSITIQSLHRVPSIPIVHCWPQDVWIKQCLCGSYHNKWWVCYDVSFSMCKMIPKVSVKSNYKIGCIPLDFKYIVIYSTMEVINTRGIFMLGLSRRANKVEVVNHH